MKHFTLAAVFLLSLSTSPFAANLLTDPSFENPITFDGAPFVGFWEGFNGGGAAAVNSPTLPRTGALSLGLSITSTPNTFAGAFQDVAGLAPGTEYNFSGWHATTSNPLDLGIEFRIEWRDSVGNVEVSRTPNSTTSPSGPLGTYTPFSLTATVPLGADTARVVYAIQSFGTAPLGNGLVYVDDVSFAVVPEPYSMALVGLGGLALIAMRRHRA